MSNIEAIKVHKADFILHIKQCNLLKDFQIADPESEFHWKKKADLAFRQLSVGYVGDFERQIGKRADSL